MQTEIINAEYRKFDKSLIWAGRPSTLGSTVTPQICLFKIKGFFSTTGNNYDDWTLAYQMHAYSKYMWLLSYTPCKDIFSSYVCYIVIPHRFKSYHCLLYPNVSWCNRWILNYFVQRITLTCHSRSNCTMQHV